MKLESKITLLWVSEARPLVACWAQAPHCSLPAPRYCPHGHASALAPEEDAGPPQLPDTTYPLSLRRKQRVPGWEVRTLTVKTSSPCSLVSFPAPGQGTLKSFGSTPTRTQRERSGPLSRHSLNVCHQAGRPGRGPPGALPLGVATRGGARPGAAGSGDSQKEGHNSLRPHLRC